MLMGLLSYLFACPTKYQSFLRMAQQKEEHMFANEHGFLKICLQGKDYEIM